MVQYIENTKEGGEDFVRCWFGRTIWERLFLCCKKKL